MCDDLQLKKENIEYILGNITKRNSRGDLVQLYTSADIKEMLD